MRVIWCTAKVMNYRCFLNMDLFAQKANREIVAVDF